MPSLTAVVLGATGLIGSQLVKDLLANDAFEKVVILVRRQVDYTHSKLEVRLVNFDDADDYRNKLGKGDCIFCCVGTTQANVKGDKAAYRKVDYDIPVNAARMGKEAVFKKYLLVSSVGADEKAGSFYLKLKGEVEQAITRENFDTLHIFQTGILLGNRKDFRLGELFGKGLINALSFLLRGKYAKYKGIQSSTVALAMLHAGLGNDRGKFVHENDAIHQLAKG